MRHAATVRSPGHRGDSPPSVNPTQLDLPARDEGEEQDDGGIFAQQSALCLHAPATFLVEPLNRLRGSQHLPLGAGPEC